MFQFLGCLVLICETYSEPAPYFYNSPNPYINFFGYSLPQYPSYGNQIPLSVTPFRPIEDLYTPTGGFPVLNVLAEAPHVVGNTFTVVPMVVVSKETMKMIHKGEIMTVSRKKPEMTLKTEQNSILRCTPVVKITLDTPMVVYSLKSNIVFPSQIEILHESFKIPIRVGSIVAPVGQDIFVSVDTPISVSVVYAIPSDPVKVDYVNNDGVIVNLDRDSVIVESPTPQLPPKNITVINFPDAEAEPQLQVDEEDEELGNYKIIVIPIMLTFLPINYIVNKYH